jgi:hypothetical protein
MGHDWRDWSSPESPWLREGYFISYERGGVRYYEHILFRDFAHFENLWFESINPDEESGPMVIEDLVQTIGYDADTTMNQLWQLIFGISGQVYVYIEHPTDIHRHGVPKVPKPRKELREVSHYEEWMSPFIEPTFLTEHIIMKPGFDRLNISMYNPETIAIQPRLNFIIAKLIAERVGKEEDGVLTTPQIPGNADRTAKLRAKWSEALDKLYRRVIPHRPLTLMPVRAPEAEV